MLIQLRWQGEEPCLGATALLTAGSGGRCRPARPWAGACDRVPRPPLGSPLSPAAGPTCAYDHGDEGLGQRGADSLPPPQPGQDPGHGAELCAGCPPQPLARQQVKPEGAGAVPWAGVLPGSDLCSVPAWARTLESASLISCPCRGSDSAQGCGLELGRGNRSAYVKSCKSTDEASFLPRILSKTIPRKKGTWIRLLLR